MEKEIELSEGLKEKVGEHTQKYLKEFIKKLSEDIQEIVWDVSNRYIENYAAYEPQDNYESKLRDFLTEKAQSWCKDPNSYWGYEIRNTLYEEHKTEILALLKNEIINEQEEKIKKLEDQIKYIQEFRSKRDYL